MTTNNETSDKKGWYFTAHPKNGDLRCFFPDERLIDKGVTLGRAQNSDMVIDDPLLSRNHCRIQLVQGKLHIIDLHSKNGVFIAGNKINHDELIALNTGDQLLLGGTRDGVNLVMARHDPHKVEGTILVDDDEEQEQYEPTPKLDRPAPKIEAKKNISNNMAGNHAQPAIGDAVVSNSLKSQGVDMAAITREVRQGEQHVAHLNANLHQDGLENFKSHPTVGASFGRSKRALHFKLPTKKFLSITSGIGLIVLSIGLGRYLAYNQEALLEFDDNTTITTHLERSTKNSPASISTKLSTIQTITPRKKLTINNEYRNINFGNFFGLVIGNNEYQHITKLDNAIFDAQAVGNTLANSYGFNVTMILNGTRADIVSTLDKYREQLTANDNFLIFFAGHGIYDKDSDRGYWLPTDAQQNTRTNWISNTDITDSVKAIQAKHIIVIADSCYSGSLTRSTDIKLPTPIFVERINGYRSRTILAAGGMEPVVDGGSTGRNSIFTTALLDALKQNKKIIDGSGLFSKIRDPIRLNTEQMPMYSDIRNTSHEPGGDFLFIRRSQ